MAAAPFFYRNKSPVKGIMHSNQHRWWRVQYFVGIGLAGVALGFLTRLSCGLAFWFFASLGAGAALWLQRKFTAVLLAVAVCVAPGQAQDLVGASMPIEAPQPEAPLAENPVLIGCALVVIAGAAWVGIKIFDKCQDIRVNQLTNTPPDLLQAPLFAAAAAVTNVPTSPVPPAVTQPPPPSRCICSAVDGDPVAMDLQVLVGERWASITPQGYRVGEVAVIPRGSRIRAVPLGLTIWPDGEIEMPRGVLQASSDLVRWEDVYLAAQPMRIHGTPNTFYRLRR